MPEGGAHGFHTVGPAFISLTTPGGPGQREGGG
ncbi:hypothetical protein COCCU_09265 [Corynebacterium occultum]|uniref:Uncharacterized protein n=1 Tax=Corynebacterium occultum TaxID=2675219 RepID=A0A6B8W779_9CORY|nr:hypothetical protein COCCU_09265 [Corynebacterium occultum]